MTGLHCRVDDKTDKPDTDKDVQKGRRFRYGFEAERAIGQVKAEDAVDIQKNNLDNLAEPERDDRQVVSPEPQGGNPDDEAENCRGRCRR